MASYIYVNKKKVEVSTRVSIIHRLSRSKRLQPYEFYNNFAKDYVVSRELFDEIYFDLHQKHLRISSFVLDAYIEYCSTSIDSSIWLAKFIALINCDVLRSYSKDYYDLMFNKFINYPNELSQDFYNLSTPLNLYKGLTIDYKNNFSCRRLIPISMINFLLKEIGTNLTEEDLRKDLNTHGIINKINSDYYEWINKPVLLWLHNTTSIKFTLLNQSKLYSNLIPYSLEDLFQI